VTLALLGHITVLARYGGTWSVCHSSEPCKIVESIEMSFGLWAWMNASQGIMWVPIPHWKGQFSEGERVALCEVLGRSSVSCAQTADLIQDAIWKI